MIENKKKGWINFLKKHPHYNRWLYMNRVCYDINKEEFNTHGLKGIIVCKEWRYDNKQSLMNSYNLSQYKNFEKWLKENYKDEIKKPLMALTRINPLKNYDKKNTILVAANKSNTVRSLVVNSIFYYQKKYFFASEMVEYLGRTGSSGRNLIKLINRKYDSDVSVWLEAWKKSRFVRDRVNAWTYSKQERMKIFQKKKEHG